MILASKALWSKNNRKMTDGLGRCFESVFFEEIIGKLLESIEIKWRILYIKIYMGRNNYIKGEIR